MDVLYFEAELVQENPMTFTIAVGWATAFCDNRPCVIFLLDVTILEIIFLYKE